MTWFTIVGIGLIVLGGYLIIRTIPGFVNKWNQRDHFEDEALCIVAGVVLVVAGSLVSLVLSRVL